MKRLFKKLLNGSVFKCGSLVYLHEYPKGYRQYHDTQVYHNQRKLHHVWADDTVLNAIAEDIRSLRSHKVDGVGGRGICHGARNGFEVEWLRKKLPGDVIGTDIAETATRFPHMHVWDFHDEKPEWLGMFDFVYTNSLDQAINPEKAIKTWSKQLKPEGRIYIEHTMAHSVEGAGEMDPFGAHPMVMPYLLFIWGAGGGGYRLHSIFEIEAKRNNGMRAWVFVLVLADTTDTITKVRRLYGCDGCAVGGDRAVAAPTGTAGPAAEHGPS